MLKEPKGFTLSELMMVVACLAILGTIAVPKWIVAGWPTHRLKNAARQVVSDIRHARMRAVATNRQYRLRFNPHSDSYLLERGDMSSGSLSWSGEGSIHKFGSNGGDAFAGVQIEGEEEFSVAFRPTGVVSSATISLKNTRNRTMKIICSMAGRVRMIRM